MNPFVRANSEKVLTDLVHDLRQSLGTMEYSACYLDMLLEGAQDAVRQQVRVLQQQLDIAAGLVSDAAARLYSPGHQRETDEESFDLTNSATASVT